MFLYTTMQYIFSLLICLCTVYSSFAQQHPDTLWMKFDNRFSSNRSWRIADYDSIEFSKTKITLYSTTDTTRHYSIITSTSANLAGDYMFNNPGRILYKPASMNCDFTNSNSQWCFERSVESEHFVVFWEKGAIFDHDYILQQAEQAWEVYVNRLKFLTPGNSKGTDKYKIIMRVYNTNDWIASGSGEDKAVGTLNLSPSACQARSGHSIAHEVGHTFQYLTDVDNGANGTHGFGWGFAPDGSGDNCFWEDCANWQAYKVYPDRQFSDGEYLEAYLNTCHLNILHENARYNNCFYQDYLCQLWGQDFIGRLWRESNRPEDPIDAIRRIKGLTQEEFSQVMYDCFAHMCTWDIEGVRDYAKHRIGAHVNRLEAITIQGETWYQPNSTYCPQNYGYNITRLKMPAIGTNLQIHFKGLAGESGYKTVYKERAGWRWGIVTLMDDGTTQYGEMQSSTEGTISYTVPSGAKMMWLVVMGAPTIWWHHLWDRWANAPATNDEQWPYRIKIEGSAPYGIFHNYTEADFGEDYQRHDTTIVIDANLAYSDNNYSSVRIQYDMDAISEALGLTTAQLKNIQANQNSNPKFVGISKTGTITYNTTTSTSTSTCLGHWFNTYGNVCNYDGSAAIFAEMMTNDYSCKVGQYPGRLKPGTTYIIRQGIFYKYNNKTYRAKMEVHLNVK